MNSFLNITNFFSDSYWGKSFDEAILEGHDGICRSYQCTEKSPVTNGVLSEDWRPAETPTCAPSMKQSG